jgi:hypothetical protein
MHGSESQSKLDSSRQIIKIKNYQATTISMSRKSSVKSIETFNKIIDKRTNLRLGRSNDTHNSSKISDRSNRQNKIMRKRRKHPSESIDNTRNVNINGKYGSTLKLFTNGSSKINQSFNSTIICHQKSDKTQLKVNKPPNNISHTEIDCKSSRFSKIRSSANSITLRDETDETDLPNNPNKSKDQILTQSNAINISLIARRSSGILRPKTSIGRNHSLYANTKKFNHSWVEEKPVESLLTHRSSSEQGNLEIIVTEPWKQEIELETTKETTESQGRPRLTKNYSLNTIFERKKNINKDFIKNNIRNVNKLSTKLRGNKSNNGSISSRHHNDESKLHKNASIGNLNTSTRNSKNLLFRVPSKSGISVNVSFLKSHV